MQRINWMDWAKFLAVALTVPCHVPQEHGAQPMNPISGYSYSEDEHDYAINPLNEQKKGCEGQRQVQCYFSCFRRMAYSQQNILQKIKESGQS